MQTYAHTHWDKFTHINTHAHQCFRYSLLLSAAPPFIPSTVRYAEQTSARELLFPTLLRGPNRKMCLRHHASRDDAELCALPEGNRFQIPPLNPQWEMTMAAYCKSLRRPARKRKKNYNCQLSAQTNKRGHKLARRNLRSWLSVCLYLFVYVCICVFLHLENSHGCMCPLPFLQCKYISHTNGQMKGLTPYLHACRDSYITNTPLWLNERADWSIK